MTRDAALDRMRVSTAARREAEEWAEKERLAAEVARKLLPPPEYPEYMSTVTMVSPGQRGVHYAFGSGVLLGAK
jgi:hypothetical protein